MDIVFLNRTLLYHYFIYCILRCLSVTLIVVLNIVLYLIFMILDKDNNFVRLIRDPVRYIQLKYEIDGSISSVHVCKFLTAIFSVSQNQGQQIGAGHISEFVCCKFIIIFSIVCCLLGVLCHECSTFLNI